MDEPRFVVRLDDACPTMDPVGWGRFEEALDALGIRPMVGVVPENEHPELECAPPDPGFWERVRGWQDRGWHIGLHGYRHILHPVERKRNLVPLNPVSEFTGLSPDDQRRKVRSGWEALRDRGVTPTLWIAPAHGFDDTTLEALRLETPIRRISDGLSRRPFRRGDFFWIPQQLWGFRRRRRGVWGVGFHPSTLTPDEITTHLEGLRRFAPRVTSDLDALEAEYGERHEDIGDRLNRRWYLTRRRLLERIVSS